MKHWLQLQAILVLFFLSVPVLSQSSYGIDHQLLSGAWEGTEGQAQRRACSIGGRGGPQTGMHYVPVRWLVKAAPDGTISAEVYYRGSNKPADIWAGKIDKSSNIELVASRVAGCNGQPRNHKITYVGKMIQKKGKYELEFKGTDPVAVK